MYANIEEFDEDRYEQEGDEAYAPHDDKVTPESEAFIDSSHSIFQILV